MQTNISLYSNSKTANTNIQCAYQRAENLYVLGSKKVLELCVGPSLEVLEYSYGHFGIECYGNDIDERWKAFYPKGNWIIGDALDLNGSALLNEVDTLVFAPPLSTGCSGRREDSLSLDKVFPSYKDFLNSYNFFKGIKVLVLPGRTLSIKRDRDNLYKLLSDIHSYEIIPLKNRITKYVDVYIPI